MQINQNVIEGKWTEIKGEVQKAWGKLTSDELEQTKGDLKAIKGLIQQKYGKTQENYQEKLEDIFGKFSTTREKTAESAKQNLRS